MNLIEQATQPSGQAYRTIPLTQGQVAIVDECDYEILAQHKWTALWCKGTGSFYAVRNSYENGQRIRVIMAREIMQAPKGIYVDHRDSITLDNRRSNLRLATPAQNIQNARQRKIPSNSGLRGVYYCPQTNKTNPWRACIGVNGKYIHLGFFRTRELASERYTAAAIEMHGEFHRAT